jgi:hypothetical protein
MNKHSFFIIPLAACALASCSVSYTSDSSSAPKASSSTTPASSSTTVSSSSSSSSVSSSEIKWVSPVGAPALAFYNQGKNTNWVSTADPTTGVLPAFGTDNYDAIVFDGVAGLNVIARNSYNYQLASWISGGNFYLVSAKHAALTDFAVGQTIDSFVQTGNASKAFTKLAKSVWNWNYAEATDIRFETGVSVVGTNLMSNPTGYDYYVIAEPVLTAAKASLAKQSPAMTLNVVANLQSEWKKAYNQTSIPAAALFVNKTSYANKKGAIDTFLAETQSRQDESVSAVDKVASTIAAYGDDAAQKSRFGFTSALVTALQPQDKFGIFKTGDITDKKAFANGFTNVFGSAAFADSLFL